MNPHKVSQGPFCFFEPEMWQSWSGSLSFVFDLKASNHPLAGNHFNGETLACSLSCFCKQEVVPVFAKLGISFTQDKNISGSAAIWAGTLGLSGPPQPKFGHLSYIWTGWHNLRGVLTSWLDPEFGPQNAYVKILATFSWGKKGQFLASNVRSASQVSSYEAVFPDH